MHEWDRRADESAAWYERFIDFCALGPRRTLRALWAEHRFIHPDETRKRPPDEWSDQRRRCAWDARAAAWDRYRQERPFTPEQHRRLVGQQRRLAIARRGVEQALRVIDAALQEELGVREAQALFPVARMLLRDMLLIERTEESDEAAASAPAGRDLALEADALHAAEVAAAELAAEKMAAAEKEAELARQAELSPADEGTLARPLLLCTGSDPALEIDLAQLRRVHAATGLEFHHLPAATRDDLSTALTRARSLGRPVRWLHLACHASHAGVEFRDGVADGAWLSRTLAGLEIVLIAGCHGDRMGDWLGVVPHVITVADEVAHAEAAALTLHFWMAIGLGLGAAAALARALDACPPAVRECVVAHW